MQLIGNYIVRICALAILCSIIKVITDKLNLSGKWIKMLAGLLMAICIVAPLKDFSVEDFDDFTTTFYSDGVYYAQQGQQLAYTQTAKFISQEVCTYILEKASEVDAQVEVSVSLSESQLPVPCGIQIKGNISPYAKQILSAYISEHIGVPEEKQVWIQGS